MAARRKNSKTARPVEDGRDKPDFAADWFQPDVRGKKQGKSGKSAQTGASKEDSEKKDNAKLSEALDGSVTFKLQQMKAALTAEAEAVERTKADKRQGQTASRATKAVQRSGVSERSQEELDTMSFAELFNPSEPDDASFKELLDEDKMDWRKFKDE